MTAVASNRVLYLVSLNHMINDGSTNLISTLFPVVVSVFGFQNFEVGVLVAIGYIVNMVFQPITGRYSERFNSRSLLAIGISIIAVSMVLFAISSTFSLMLIAIIILRLGSSFFHPVGVSAVSRNYVGSRLDRAMGFESAFGNLGVLIVFLIAAPIYLMIGWRGPFLLFALFDALTVGLTLALMKGITTPVESISLKAMGEKNFLKTNHRFGLPLFFILTMLISGGAYAVFANFGNLLLTRSFDLAQSDSLMAGWVIAAFFGALVTGPIIRVIKRQTLLVVSYLIAATSTLAFAIFSQNAPIAVVSLLINGFSLSITYPIIYSELSRYLGEKSLKKGTYYGILFSAQIIGSSILGLFGGYLADVLGWGFLFEITSVLLVVALILSILWPNQVRDLLSSRAIVK